MQLVAGSQYGVSGRSIEKCNDWQDGPHTNTAAIMQCMNSKG
jgi:hypothetical protein